LSFLSVIHYWFADSQSLSAKVIGEVFSRLSAQQQQRQQQTQTTKTTASVTAAAAATTTTTATNTNNSKNKYVYISQYAVIQNIIHKSIRR